MDAVAARGTLEETKDRRFKHRRREITGKHRGGRQDGSTDGQSAQTGRADEQAGRTDRPAADRKAVQTGRRADGQWTDRPYRQADEQADRRTLTGRQQTDKQTDGEADKQVGKKQADPLEID